MTGYCRDCGNTLCLCDQPRYVEGTGRMVDPILHHDHETGTVTIDWPQGTTDADWVKVSVPLLRDMNDELNRLRQAPPATGGKGSLRVRSTWRYCERTGPNIWEAEFVKDPDPADWDYCTHVLFDDQENLSNPDWESPFARPLPPPQEETP